MKRGLIHFFLTVLLAGASLAHAATVHEGFFKVVDTHQKIPALRSAFSELSVPTSSQGRVTFLGFFDLSHFGVYTNLSDVNAIDRVANNRTQVPLQNHFFTRFHADNETATLPVMLGSSVLFYAQSGEGIGLYQYHHQHLHLVVDNATPMPGTSTQFAHFAWAQWLENGGVMFVGEGDHQTGIFITDQSGHLKLVKKINQITLPGKINAIHQLKQLAIDPKTAPDIYTFIAEGKKHAVGIYQMRQGHIKKIVDTDSSMPGGLGFFNHFVSVSEDKNKVTFIGKGALGQEGVYENTSHGIKKIADSQTLMPQTQVHFSSFNALTSQHGWVVFQASGDQGIQGVYLYTDKDGLFKLLSNHDSINGKQVKSVKISPYSLDGKNLAMHVTFKDNTQAIFVSTINVAAY